MAWRSPAQQHKPAGCQVQPFARAEDQDQADRGDTQQCLVGEGISECVIKSEDS
jgi:hypothetical protein